MWNANSLVRDLAEFYNYLSHKDIHIAFISETCFKPHMNIKHPKYTIHRNDRLDASRGGVALFIKKSIKHKQMKTIKCKLIESIGIELLTNNSSIKLVSIYVPGGVNIAQHKTEFKADINLLTKMNEKFLICGDFNARNQLWNCSTTNTAGKLLMDVATSNGTLIIHPNTPTHFPSDQSRNPSTIDLILSNLHNVSNIVTNSDLYSDHKIVCFQLGCDEIHDEVPNRIPVYSQTDWVKYTRIINENITLCTCLLYTSPSPRDRG